MIIKYWMFCALIGGVLIFSACGGTAESNESSTEETGVDTTEVDTLAELEEKVVPERISYDVNKLLARIDTVFQLPFIVDSAMLDSMFVDQYYESSLTNAEAQYLGFKTPDSSPASSASYCINEFIDIDSIKLKGEYEAFVETVDLGQTEDACAHLMGQVKISNNEYYILWTTAYHTYEACPYGHGSYIWATYFKDNQPYEAVLIGETSGGGDAPYWMGTAATSVITKKGIEAYEITESGGDENEDGEEIIETTEKWASYKLNAEGLFEVEVKEKN